MAAVKTKGREQRKRTKSGRARQPALDGFYRFALPPITPGDFTFQLTLLRPQQKAVSLDRMCESFEWEESSRK